MIEGLQLVLQEKFCRPTIAPLMLTDGESKMTVHLSDFPNNGLIVNLNNMAHTGLVKRGKGYEKSCDYLIIVPQGEDLNCYFVEMKKTIDLRNKEKAYQQIRATLPTFDYLKGMVETHHFPISKIHKHFIVIGKKRSERLNIQRIRTEPFEKDTEYFDKGICKKMSFRIFYSEDINFQDFK